MKLIMVHGGNPNTPHLCKRAAWDYGAQFGTTLYQNPVMMDFVEGDFDKYLEHLSHYRPELALACDWLEHRHWQEYDKRIMAIAELGIIPIVAAKHPEALLLTPNFCCGIEVRIGISVPTSYMNDGWIPPRDLLKKSTLRDVRTLHLLGGHPDQWKWLIQYYGEVGVNVLSIDGNAHYEQAYKYGKFWSQWGYYREMRGKGHNTNALAICSMKNASRYLSNRAPVHLGDRIQACKKQLGLLPKQLELFAIA
jgi:hypothetical protein